MTNLLTEPGNPKASEGEEKEVTGGRESAHQRHSEERLGMPDRKTHGRGYLKAAFPTFVALLVAAAATFVLAGLVYILGWWDVLLAKIAVPVGGAMVGFAFFRDMRRSR